jgi:acyl carrier protein
MQSTQTITELREFVTSNFYVPAELGFDDTSSFLAQGILDSTGVLELVTFVENRFGISVQDDELVPANFDSLAALSAYVERKQAWR